MRRIVFNVSIAFMTFLLGTGLALTLARYHYSRPSEASACGPKRTELIALAVPLPPLQTQSEAKPGSLPAELLRIDRIYFKRCQLPTDWSGHLPTVVQLDQFSVCNDEWAQARRKAIVSERENYLIQY